MLLNLIINAIEAIDAVGEEPRELLVSSAKDESRGVLVAVRDSGTGLDSGKLDHLFDAFYTTKRNGNPQISGRWYCAANSAIDDSIAYKSSIVQHEDGIGWPLTHQRELARRRLLSRIGAQAGRRKEG